MNKHLATLLILLILWMPSESLGDSDHRNWRIEAGPIISSFTHGLAEVGDSTTWGYDLTISKPIWKSLVFETGYTDFGRSTVDWVKDLEYHSIVLYPITKLTTLQARGPRIGLEWNQKIVDSLHIGLGGGTYYLYRSNVSNDLHFRLKTPRWAIARQGFIPYFSAGVSYEITEFLSFDLRAMYMQYADVDPDDIVTRQALSKVYSIQPKISYRYGDGSGDSFGLNTKFSPLFSKVSYTKNSGSSTGWFIEASAPLARGVYVQTGFIDFGMSVDPFQGERPDSFGNLFLFKDQIRSYGPFLGTSWRPTLGDRLSIELGVSLVNLKKEILYFGEHLPGNDSIYPRSGGRSVEPLFNMGLSYRINRNLRFLLSVYHTRFQGDPDDIQYGDTTVKILSLAPQFSFSF